MLLLVVVCAHSSRIFSPARKFQCRCGCYVRYGYTVRGLGPLRFSLLAPWLSAFLPRFSSFCHLPTSTLPTPSITTHFVYIYTYPISTMYKRPLRPPTTHSAAPRHNNDGVVAALLSKNMSDSWEIFTGSKSGKKGNQDQRQLLQETMRMRDCIRSTRHIRPDPSSMADRHSPLARASQL
ncbi:hypothetical protein K438DRAFT_382790 [Mycena galopus ATCC 62051]|nr:hypothetical protein K438DRAFT_382790 [Mycena galopus ATCC 62051]